MPTVQEAVKTLLNVCDGAAAQDRMGFNKWDSQIARSLEKSQWTPPQLRLAWRILRKYKKQLSEHGIDYDAMPEPKVEEKPQQNRLMYIKEGKIAVRFDYHALLVDKIKDLPYQVRKYDPASREWTLQVNIDTVEKIWDLAIYGGFSLTEETEEALENVVKIFTESIEASRAESAELEIPGLARPLRPFQKVVPLYVQEKRKALISDPVGSGKSTEALASIHYLNSFPSIVVCPSSVKLNWEKEVKLNTPQYSVEILNGKPGKFNADITIVNYDILKKHFDGLKSLGAKSIICDESTYIKNKNTQRGKLVGELIQDIEIPLFLTGTPILNRPSELLYPLQLLGVIDELGGSWRFLTHYCNARKVQMGSKIFLDTSGSSNEGELNARLRSVCMIKREKADIMKELPSKQTIEIDVNISNQAEYNKREKEFLEFLEESGRNEQFLLSLNEELDALDISSDERQSLFEKKVEGRKNAEAIMRMTELRKCAALGKIESAISWLEDFRETEEKIVVVTRHKEITQQLAEKFQCELIIDGSVSSINRQKHIDVFQSDPSQKMILLAQDAGGMGINLFAASTMLILELPWNPGVLEQIEGRIWRMGQQNNVNIYHMIGKKTIDEYLRDMIKGKGAVISAATGQKISFLNSIQQRINQR